MNKIRVFSFLVGLFLISSSVAYADLGFFASIDATCDGFTLTWGPPETGGSSTVSIFINDELFSTATESATNGTITESIDPPLTGTSVVRTLIAISGTGFAANVTDSVTVDCSEADTATTSVEYIQLCGDGRTNINVCEPLAIYPLVSEAGTGMIIYSTPRGSNFGVFELAIPAEALQALPTAISEACVVDASDDGDVVVYLLTTGEIQINIGPDEEGKVFVFRYAAFPGQPELETFIGETALPTEPSCF